MALNKIEHRFHLTSSFQGVGPKIVGVLGEHFCGV